MALDGEEARLNPDPPASLLELGGLTFVFGSLGGCVFALFDVVRHAPRIAAVDALIAVGFSGVVGAILLLGVGVVLAVISKMTPWGRSRLTCAALLTGSLVLSVSIAVIVVGAQNLGNLTGLFLLLVPAPLVAVAAAMFVARIKWLGNPGSALVVALGAIQTLILGLCGALALRSWSHSLIVAGAWVGVMMIAFVAIAIFARRVPRRTGCALALSLPVSAAAIIWSSVAPNTSLSAPSADKQERPNVVLIVLDTTRRDYLGCYGDSEGLTPELDRIAGEGVVYEDAISAAPWTVPSHASIFTGLHPVTHGCSYEHRLWLHDDFTTMAEVLGSNGYQTVALSSNIYLEACNMLQGFEYRKGLAGNYDGLTLHGLARYLGIPSRWTDKGCAEACADIAAWFRDERDPDQPLFLFVNLLEPHRPYLPPAAERAELLKDQASYLSATNLATGFDYFLANARRKHDSTASKIMRPLYRAAIKYQDRRMAELIAMLGDRIDLDRTLLIITSDHGENIGEAGRWEHLFDINDTLIHIPLIIRYPELFAPGTRVKGLCQTIDFVPTIYDVVGLAQPDLPGRSLVPDRFVPREATFAQTSPFYPMLGPLDVQLGFARGSVELRGHLRALRTDSYKFVSSSTGKRELYDIVHDPFEETNLYAAMPEEAARLERQLNDWWNSQPVFVPRATEDQAADQEELTTRLRSLGYIK